MDICRASHSTIACPLRHVLAFLCSVWWVTASSWGGEGGFVERVDLSSESILCCGCSGYYQLEIQELDRGMARLSTL